MDMKERMYHVYAKAYKFFFLKVSNVDHLRSNKSYHDEVS